MKIGKILIGVVVLVGFVLGTVGCPSNIIQKSNPYVKDAQKFVKDVNKEYPKVSAAIKDACVAELIEEEPCLDFDNRLDPAITDVLKALDDLITFYQEAMGTYQETLSGGTEEEVNDQWVKVSAALNAVVTKLGEATQLYFDAVKIYNTVKGD